MPNPCPPLCASTPLLCSSLQQGTDQVFYHVLVDARDWPPGGDHPPVAYVAEELLTAGSSVDFASETPLVRGGGRPGRVVCSSCAGRGCLGSLLATPNATSKVDARGLAPHCLRSPGPLPSPQDGSFEHPYSYLLFLGADGQGNMVRPALWPACLPCLVPGLPAGMLAAPALCLPAPRVCPCCSMGTSPRSLHTPAALSALRALPPITPTTRAVRRCRAGSCGTSTALSGATSTPQVGPEEQQRGPVLC